MFLNGSRHLPWDLLVVDESRNLALAAFRADGELSKMLRTDGRTRCFSGLLEIPDPPRLSQISEFTPAEWSRVQEVLLRRLKGEINEVMDPP
jgi:hypothetical protein